MKKIYDYKIEIDENGIGDIYIKKDADSNFEYFTEIVDAANMSASELNERASVILKSYDYIVDKSKFMESERGDLFFIRKKMKAILKALSDTDTNIEEKKSLLPVHSQMCSASQIIINSCKLELQIERVIKGKK